MLQLTFEGSWPTAVALTPSGRKLVAGNEKGQLFVWDLPEATPDEAGKKEPDKKEVDKKESDKKEAPNLAPVRQLVGHTNGITRLVALPDGKTVASASLDHSIRLWNLDAPASGSAEVILNSEKREQQAKRGNKAALDAPGIKVETQTDCRLFAAHDDWVSALAMSRDGKQLISGDYRSQVIVWDVATGKPLTRWAGLPWNWILAAAFSPDAKTALVSECRYKRDDFDVPAAALRLWDISAASTTETAKVKLDLLKVQFDKYDPQASSYEASQIWRKFVSAGLVAVDISPDGKLLAVGQGGENDKGVIHVLDSSTGKLVRDVSGHQYGITDLRFSADGQKIYSVGRDTTLRITNLSDGKELHALNSPRGGQFKDWLSALSLSADERVIAASDIAGLVHVWSSK